MGLRTVMILLVVSGCGDGREGRGSARAERINPNTTPIFAPHPQYVQVGPPGGAVDTLENPFANDEAARAEGERLYQQYNCVSCHGGDGAGGIGPTLNDPRFKYGGSPAEIYQSIYEGRPEGMPVWGGQIPDEHIWKLVAYLRSLESPDVTTITWPGIPAQAGRTTPAR